MFCIKSEINMSFAQLNMILLCNLPQIFAYKNTQKSNLIINLKIVRDQNN